jgi:hypothetical protein
MKFCAKVWRNVGFYTSHLECVVYDGREARDAPFAGHALCNALKLVEMPLDQTVRSVSAGSAFGICEDVNFARQVNS